MTDARIDKNLTRRAVADQRKIAGKVEALVKVFSSAELAEKDFQEIANLFAERDFQKGEAIFLEGDDSDRLWIVKSGKVKIVKHSDTGKDLLVGVISAGEMFGGVAVFGKEPYPASAEAMEPTVALGIRRRDFVDLVGRYPTIAFQMIDELGKRLKEAHEMMRSLAMERVERRIAHVLLKLAQKLGSPCEDGIIINTPLTRQDIADMAGTTVETSIRVMSRLTKDGIVRPAAGKVMIANPHALVIIAEEL
ncbi:MAG: Crp/Fnr family transcriptional regulator [Chloroflexi bacterium]|nr:Crp/Fnr family transcriptional regulator [Chloroflexota bacterium]